MTNFDPNLLIDFQQMIQYPFMQHAFEAGTVTSIIAGIIGYFVVLRGSTFTAHAFSEIGFAGAAGAVLVSIPPVFGLLAASSAGGMIIALLGKKAAHRDVQIGITLAFFLGLGVLFISLYRGYATFAYSILFGEILAVSESDVITSVIATILILVVLSVIYRPLLFSSLDEDVAEAKGMPMFSIGIVFMLLVAATVSFAVQVVGVLLIFSLIVTPAAVGQRLAKRPRQAIAISVVVALAATWCGLFVSFFTPYPTSFFITGFVFALYLLARLAPRLPPTKGSRATPVDHGEHVH